MHFFAQCIMRHIERQIIKEWCCLLTISYRCIDSVMLSPPTTNKLTRLSGSLINEAIKCLLVFNHTSWGTLSERSPPCKRQSCCMTSSHITRRALVVPWTLAIHTKRIFASIFHLHYFHALTWLSSHYTQRCLWQTAAKSPSSFIYKYKFALDLRLTNAM